MIATDPRKDNLAMLEILFPCAGDFACSDVVTRVVTFTSGFNGARYEMPQTEWASAVNSARANIPA